MGETVGTRIRRLARIRGLGDGEALAAKFGVSYETLRKWTSGDSAPNRSRQALIASLLQVPVEAFMFGVEVLESVATRPERGLPAALVEVAASLQSLTGVRLTMAKAALHQLIDHPEMVDEVATQIETLVVAESTSRKQTAA